MNSIVDSMSSFASAGVAIALCVVVVLIVILSIVSMIVSIVLAIAYIRYNHKKNSLGMSGYDIARRVLDENGLSQIKVSATGSILFGNSYSHYFKKVRLRRWTYKKLSVASMVMAVQKSALALLDKEQDPDMIKRNKLIPIVTFGPFAFIPLLIVGVVLDAIVFHTQGTFTMICIVVGLLFYVYSFVLSLMFLRTEKKAQERSLVMMREQAYANDQEIEMARKLFRLYNIEYVNNMIMALLELIYNILRIALIIMDKGSSRS